MRCSGGAGVRERPRPQLLAGGDGVRSPRDLRRPGSGLPRGAAALTCVRWPTSTPLPISPRAWPASSRSGRRFAPLDAAFDADRVLGVPAQPCAPGRLARLSAALVVRCHGPAKQGASEDVHVPLQRSDCFHHLRRGPADGVREQSPHGGVRELRGDEFSVRGPFGSNHQASDRVDPTMAWAATPSSTGRSSPASMPCLMSACRSPKKARFRRRASAAARAGCRSLCRAAEPVVVCASQTSPGRGWPPAAARPGRGSRRMPAIHLTPGAPAGQIRA